MKVLYIGHYRENNTGWGEGCLAMIKTLLAIPGLDLVCRPIQFGDSNPNIPEEVLECENKLSRGCDICIQHILPHLMEYNGHFKKCIGYFYGETARTQYSSWPAKLNLMDEIWCPNSDQVWNTHKSGVDVPIHMVPYACDLDKYLRSYEPLPLPEIEGKFTFYFIGENIRRKNIPALVKAFHTEFSTSEPVALVIKTSMPGASPEQTHQILDETCNEIKRSLKLYSDVHDYHSEIIIPFHYTDEQIMSLHSMCDSFVMPSCGESVCIPAFDAMAMGKIPICNNNGGPRDFLHYSDELRAGFLTKNTETIVTGMNNTFQDLFTGYETWYEVDALHLRQQMRIAYEMTDEAKAKLAYKGLEIASNYTYEEIGKKVKELIDG